MKNYVHILKSTCFLVLVIALNVFTSCRKDDGGDIIVPPEPEVVEKTVFGKWEIVSGRFLIDNSKFVHINENNTLYVLSEDDMGFKKEYTTNITVTENQMTTSAHYGSEIHNHVLEGDQLTIILPGGAGEVKLSRKNSAPEPEDWVKALTIIDEGNAPWEGVVDIAYNGSHILYGIEDGGNQIGLVNPTTFDLDGTIPTTRHAHAVEVEKYDDPGRYIFQSNNGFPKFYTYREDNNVQAFESIDTGSWIRGLASVDDTRIWVSSGNENAIYLYQYLGADEIISTIDLDFQPYGMDYQAGYLYISDGVHVHKCELNTGLRAIESYKVQNHKAKGIAYDGTNFWLSTTSLGGNKLIKIGLSI